MSETFTIWKYAIPVTDYFPIEMPDGARVLSVQAQQDQPCLWALVNPAAARRTRFFRLVGTGHPFEGGRDYCGSFQLNGGAIVFHLFEAETANE